MNSKWKLPELMRILPADCANRNGNKEEALKYYIDVIQVPIMIL